MIFTATVRNSGLVEKELNCLVHLVERFFQIRPVSDAMIFVVSVSFTISKILSKLSSSLLSRKCVSNAGNNVSCHFAFVLLCVLLWAVELTLSPKCHSAVFCFD